MGEAEQQQWVQVPSDFFNAYQAWKENLIKKQQESFLFSSSSSKNDIENSRIGAQSVYEKAPPIPGVSILKKQMLNQTELAPAGSLKFRCAWEIRNVKSSEISPHCIHLCRLTGDFFEYLTKLEISNFELQKQLDTAVSKLEKTSIDAIRAQNSEKQHKDTMNSQIIKLVQEYKNAEREHQVQLQDLRENMEILQQELTLKTIAMERQKSEIQQSASSSPLRVGRSEQLSGIPAADDILQQPTCSTDQGQEDNSTTVEDSSTLEQIKTLLLSEKSQNMYLTALCDKTNQELVDKEKEVEQLWCRVYELHENLKTARESEIAFQSQSIAIEELRSQLELARHTANVQEQASIIEAMLPATNSRLGRSDEGWEWTPWLKQVSTKAIEVDFNGIMEELKDLKEHRSQAFKRAKNRGMDIVNQILKELGLLRLTAPDESSKHLDSLEE